MTMPIAKPKSRVRMNGTVSQPRPMIRQRSEFNNRDVAGLSVSSLATVYGCCGLFDLCGDADLMSLSFEGANKFLDWIGWEKTDVCKIQKYFITYTRPAYSGGEPTSGVVADPCGDENGVEWGKCDFVLTDFARLRRHGPVRDTTKIGLRLCENQPRYRLDGTPITDDREYDMYIVTEVILQDLKALVISGNASNEGEADGLENLIVDNYHDSQGRRCSSMDSFVVDWNANTLDGGAGITWNGQAIGATFNFIDVLQAIYRRVRARIALSPALSARDLSVGDMIFVMPDDYIDCLLNFYTCWRVCPGEQYNENNLQSFDARNFRNSLNGGMFGAGRIFLHGFEIPIMPYSWGLLKGPTRFDGYLLTGQIGGIKLIQGQYNDMSGAASRKDRYSFTDGGRLLTWGEDDKTCERRVVEMQPRLLAWAPWAQARFIDLKCSTVLGPMSPDPTSSFFPETSFNGAECPTP